MCRESVRSPSTGRVECGDSVLGHSPPFLAGVEGGGVALSRPKEAPANRMEGIYTLSTHPAAFHTLTFTLPRPTPACLASPCKISPRLVLKYLPFSSHPVIPLPVSSCLPSPPLSLPHHTQIHPPLPLPSSPRLPLMT